MNSIAKRVHNFVPLCLCAFVTLRLRSLVLISVHSWFKYKKVTKMSQMQNEPKTNPNEPNFSEVIPRSKRNIKDSRQIQTTLFMQNEPNLFF